MTKPWTPWDNEVENADLRRMSGTSASQVAAYLNETHHRGQTVRTKDAVTNRRKWLSERSVANQEVERTESDGRIILKSNGSRITTIDELLAHAQVDTTRWQIASQRVKAWDASMRGEDGPQTVQNFALHVEVEPKAGPNVLEAVEAIVAGAFADRTPLPVRKHKASGSGLMQGLFIMDPHIGKRSWPSETRRGPWDLPIGVQTLREANADLIQRGNDRKVAERVIFLGGDFFNADTKAGTTTGGTPLENDSRIQKMLEEGSQALLDIIEWSADHCQTKVVIIPGNHDASKTWALQLIVQAYFRKDQRVTIDAGYQTRKYHVHGKCLLGLTHGDKGWKRLPGLMSREASTEWGQTTLRHIHHGHFHSKRQVDTVDGVTVFQHPALCETDTYHVEEGFISDRGQESYYYHTSGVLVGMDYYSPDVDAPVTRGVK